MNLEQFAKHAGVVLSPCDPKVWGGSIAYSTKDWQEIKTCGFRSNNAAYRHWLDDTFGGYAADALRKILDKSPSKASSPVAEAEQ